MKVNRVWIWSGLLVLAGVVAAGVFLPLFIKARSTAACYACLNNLRMIHGAEEQAVSNKELPPDADCDEPANKKE